MTSMVLPPYVPDPFSYRRRKTRTVRVGRLGIGGANPLRIQSMTTTDTMDTQASLEQVVRLAHAGCEIVRLAVPTVEAARSLEAVRNGLIQRRVEVPLVADVHFQPEAASAAADFVDKVRINPGNFAQGQDLREKLFPLIEKLKRLGRSLRIGVNHGSLSERILGRYGDTPQGMVESALEYARLCEESGYRELVFSMKSSNVKVMIAAYRLLAARMAELGMDYPFHLGVTEAGEGEDGRIKSAIGIGSLLEDGIGDTLRVSLTEEPEAEVPVCRVLAGRFQARPEQPIRLAAAGTRCCADSYSYARRAASRVRLGPLSAGSGEPVRVLANWPLGTEPPGGLGDRAAEVLSREIRDADSLGGLRSRGSTVLLLRADGPLPLALDCLARADLISWTGWRVFDEPQFVSAVRRRGVPLLIEAPDVEEVLRRGRLSRQAGLPVILGLRGGDPSALLREYRLLAGQGRDFPIHVRAPRAADKERQILESATFIGSLLCDGIGDSVEIDAGWEPRREAGLAYDILQAAGARLTKAEFVSCPGCGRTLYDLQAAAARVKKELGHLKGLKIAVMGCVVNGPGEMADADFGYVGGAPGKINLYAGKECVRKGVPEEKAIGELRDLIKQRGKWAEL
jgi:(E)-4-hydroxy-3-methylbut-2-enyl-diphosphate synthase